MVVLGETRGSGRVRATQSLLQIASGDFDRGSDVLIIDWYEDRLRLDLIDAGVGGIDAAAGVVEVHLATDGVSEIALKLRVVRGGHLVDFLIFRKAATSMFT